MASTSCLSKYKHALEIDSVPLTKTRQQNAAAATSLHHKTRRYVNTIRSSTAKKTPKKKQAPFLIQTAVVWNKGYSAKGLAATYRELVPPNRPGSNAGNELAADTHRCWGLCRCSGFLTRLPRSLFPQQLIHRAPPTGRATLRDSCPFNSSTAESVTFHSCCRRVVLGVKEGLLAGRGDSIGGISDGLYKCSLLIGSNRAK